MIKTKLAFATFLLLSIIIFPYYIIYLQSDYLSSMVPGWNTNIYPGEMMGDLLKFMILSVSVYFYWKLSKNIKEISFRRFLIHLALTFPAIIISKVSFYEFFSFTIFDSERIIGKTHLIVYFITATNILFFLSQMFFWRYYIKSKEKFQNSN